MDTPPEPTILHPDDPRPVSQDEIRARKQAIRAGDIAAPPRDELPETDAERDARLESARQVAEENQRQADAKCNRPVPGDYLLGSGAFEPTYEIAGCSIPLGQLVSAAQINSGLTVDEWNGLGETDRDAHIGAELESVRAHLAPPDATDPAVAAEDAEIARMLDEAES